MSDWQIRVLYDGECPLCSKEIRMLERRDRGRGRIDLEDIAAPDFDARKYGLTADDVMARIHGVLPDGRVVEGVEVFRRAYQAVGLGWLMAPTRWPGLRNVADAGYRVFARNRLRWTGRADTRTSGRADTCTSDRCAPRPATQDGSEAVHPLRTSIRDRRRSPSPSR